MSVDVKRTPESRFAVLPNFPYKPQYVEDLKGYEDLRMHYVDAGQKDSNEVFLCLHGEPTWSYLYRKMIPVFSETGARVIAPDFFGFGRSDKPINDCDITYDFHRNSLLAFIEKLDLRNITLVCQDWGGILGLSIPMEMPERFNRLIVMNTALPIGEKLSDGFDQWKAYASSFNDIPCSGIMAAMCPGQLDWMDIAAYAAPFPDESYQAGVRRFPQLVAIEPGMASIEIAQRAREFWSTQWQGQSFMAIGLQDIVLGLDVMTELHAIIRNCPAPLQLEHAGHFVQECGEEVARAALLSFSTR